MSANTIDLDFGDTVTLSNCGDKISGVVERMTALAVEKPGTVPADLLATCIDVAAVAIAVQMAEHKAISESEGTFQSFDTFQSQLFEGDIFTKGRSDSAAGDMFTSRGRRPASSGVSGLAAQASKSESALDYDFSGPGAFAARYR